MNREVVKIDIYRQRQCDILGEGQYYKFIKKLEVCFKVIWKSNGFIYNKEKDLFMN